MNRTTLIIATIGLFLIANTDIVLGQVIEIPRPFLRGYAKATTVRGQPVIFYNPYAIRRTGPDVARFIRAHEYAHFRLGHHARYVSPRRAELEADILASRSVPRSSLIATQRWFARGNGGGFIHGTSLQRARRLGYGFSGRVFNGR